MNRVGLGKRILLTSASLCALAQPSRAAALPTPDFSRVPGVVIDHSPAASRRYVGSPSLVVLPNGDYVASHDWFGPGTPNNQTVVFGSLDRGRTWTRLTELEGQWWSSLFVHHGALYLMGTSGENGLCVIRRSTDGGQTWTTPRDRSSGLLLADGKYHCAPVPVVVHAGRLWRAMEDAKGPGGWGLHFHAFMMSAPVDADLLDASSWTCSERLGRNPDWLGGKFGGWLEGNAVVTPQGRIVDLLRVDSKPEGGKAAVIDISDHGKRATFDPATGFIDFPGGAKKFSIRFDPKTRCYWSLVNWIPPRQRGPDPSMIRNTLALVRSPDLRHWTVRTVVLYHPDSAKHGFQYVDWQFDGEDLIAVSRTAFDDGLGGAYTQHDANFLTFHRIRRFRELTAADAPPELRDQSTAATAPANSSEEARTVKVTVSLDQPSGPLEVDRIGLGQGGLSPDPMWADRAAEIRALHPRLIRLFIQEYFDLLPQRGRYHFETLDRSVDLILRTGARPLMCIACKPRALFPKVDQDIVEPTDYAAWEKLVFNLVQHYRKRGADIRYWEIMNEPDIGEDGGCPYRFQPESYVRFYWHTAAAIRRADPQARVGGPALANSGSPLLPALLDACDSGNVPLQFVSWHIYSSSPQQIRGTIERVHVLLKKHPNLHPETILDEWNMALSNPPSDPRVQPCFIAEVAWQMKDAGLDFSCYYQIRDYHVAFDDFTGFMSPHGTAFMAAWWNRRPQFDGLFDFQDTVRPSYFAFKLLSRLTGDRLRLSSDDAAVHGFATYDPRFQAYNLLLWNFSPKPVRLDLTLAGMQRALIARPLWLDAVTASNDENARLRVEDAVRITPANHDVEVTLAPYAVRFWSLDRAR